MREVSIASEEWESVLLGDEMRAQAIEEIEDLAPPVERRSAERERGGNKVCRAHANPSFAFCKNQDKKIRKLTEAESIKKWKRLKNPVRNRTGRRTHFLS